MSKSESRSVSRLDRLLERLCEDRITQDGLDELETLILKDDRSKQRYFDYLFLHGTLNWNVANAHDSGNLNLDAHSLLADTSLQDEPAKISKHKSSFGRLISTVGLLACLLILGLYFGIFSQQASSPNGQPNLADNPATVTPENNENQTDKPLPKKEHKALPEKTIIVDSLNPPMPKEVENNLDNKTTDPSTGNKKPTKVVASNEDILPNINQYVSTGWKDAEIRPSSFASDAEWGRRIYLDIIGRIPSQNEALDFLNDSRPDKRQRLAKRLLNSKEYSRYTASIWSNLLVGRSPKNESLREPLRMFLADAFAEDRAWNAVVSDLITATGTPQDNGATGFLLAHLDNNAVPATAVTARMLLGVQLQCVQCHPHPFNKRKQEEFWEFNSFFHDLKMTWVKQNGKRTPSLKTVNSDDPVYFESRDGVMNVAFPKYGETEIEVSTKVSRRDRLADLMARDNQKLMAKSAVNRIWARYFGFGFTVPIDDIGSHNSPSYPELFNFLTEKFIASGYNVRKLTEWIVLSDAYQRSSEITKFNTIDDPARGEAALFSRVYVKTMTPEQIFNSLQMLNNGSPNQTNSSWKSFEHKRDKWVQQYVISYETEENTEYDLFDGSIRQALEMMNGKLMDNVVKSVSSKVPNSKTKQAKQISQLSLATLSRYPSSRELSAFREVLKKRANSQDEVFKDILWAYLNSNEFILVH